MVSQTVKLPNIRKLFIPDPGMVIADADLSTSKPAMSFHGFDILINAVVRAKPLTL